MSPAVYTFFSTKNGARSQGFKGAVRANDQIRVMLDVVIQGHSASEVNFLPNTLVYGAQETLP
jgi:hypothetical protein